MYGVLIKKYVPTSANYFHEKNTTTNTLKQEGI